MEDKDKKIILKALIIMEIAIGQLQAGINDLKEAVEEFKKLVE